MGKVTVKGIPLRRAGVVSPCVRKLCWRGVELASWGLRRRGSLWAQAHGLTAAETELAWFSMRFFLLACFLSAFCLLMCSYVLEMFVKLRRHPSASDTCIFLSCLLIGLALSIVFLIFWLQIKVWALIGPNYSPGLDLCLYFQCCHFTSASMYSLSLLFFLNYDGEHFQGHPCSVWSSWMHEALLLGLLRLPSSRRLMSVPKGPFGFPFSLKSFQVTWPWLGNSFVRVKVRKHDVDSENQLLLYVFLMCWLSVFRVWTSPIRRVCVWFSSHCIM